MYELITITEDGQMDTIDFTDPPSTQQMLSQTSKNERWLVTREGDLWVVYDRQTSVVKYGTFEGRHYIIAPPVFSCADQDVAIMWALMRGAG